MVRPVPEKKIDKNRVHECIGYIRVSTKGQAEYGVSLDTQKKMIIEYCNNPANHCHIDPARIYVDEGKSAFRHHKKRSGYLNAKRDIERGRGDTLIVYALNRAFRTMSESVLTMQLLSDKNADIISLTEGDQINTTTKSGRLIYNLISVLSEFESQQTGERVRDNMLRNFEEKGFGGQRRPTGYEFIKEWKDEYKNGKTQKTLKVVSPYYIKHNDGEREITEKVFELYKKIGQRRIKNETGLTLSVVGWMISNPVYCGYNLIVAKDGEYRIKKGEHEPYITREEFNRNVDRRIERAKNKYHEKTPPYKILLNKEGKPYLKFIKV